MSRRHRTPDLAATQGAVTDLDRLVATEQRLEASVADARAEAERIVEEAHTAARGGEQAFERECQEALAQIQSDIETTRDRAIAAIAADARRRAQAFDEVTEDRVAELAAYVVDRVIGVATDGSNR